MAARPRTVETRLSLASRPAPTGTRTARSAIVVDREALREVLLALRPVRVPAVRLVRLAAVAGLRRVVLRLVVVARCCVPGVLVAMGSLLLPIRSHLRSNMCLYTTG